MKDLFFKIYDSVTPWFFGTVAVIMAILLVAGIVGGLTQ
jgi:hypothetical protein